VYTKQELGAVKKEPNIYLHIEFMPETKQFRVTIPHAAYRPVVDTLAEAMQIRDRMVASPHFPSSQRYEPRKENACYVDPNLETRTHEA
jgi:hypothetical protein